MQKLTALLFVMAILACNEAKFDTKSEGEKVMQTSREWAEAASKKDVEKTLSYWADDAVLYSSGELPLKGKAEIRQMVEGGFKTPGFHISWQPKSAVVSESGDMAYLIENSQITYNDSTGKPVTIKNDVVTIWRKQADGSWKNVVDISTPAPTGK